MVDQRSYDDEREALVVSEEETEWNDEVHPLILFMNRHLTVKNINAVVWLFVIGLNFAFHLSRNESLLVWLIVSVVLSLVGLIYTAVPALFEQDANHRSTLYNAHFWLYWFWTVSVVGTLLNQFISTRGWQMLSIVICAVHITWTVAILSSRSTRGILTCRSL